MKPLQAIKNNAGGYDLLTERDADNPVRCLTGRYSNSLEYWKRLRRLASSVIEHLEETNEGDHPQTINQ